MTHFSEQSLFIRENSLFASEKGLLMLVNVLFTPEKALLIPKTVCLSPRKIYACLRMFCLPLRKFCSCLRMFCSPLGIFYSYPGKDVYRAGSDVSPKDFAYLKQRIVTYRKWRARITRNIRQNLK